MNDSELERLGISIAQKCGWNGDKILKVCKAALTDANFHSESEIVEQMLEAVESSDDTPEYKLEVITGNNGSQLPKPVTGG